MDEGTNVPTVKMLITRFLDAGFPGFVELQLEDAYGKTHVFGEKIPVVTELDIWADSVYPIDAKIECEIQKRFTDDRGRSLIRVDTELPWHIESNEGISIFEVLASQVTEE
jgi:hypothetical protein